MTDWSNYYTKHASRKPREQVVRAIELCTNKDSALDLGAGTLVESTFLLQSGFNKVIALDNSPEIKKFAEDLDPKHFSLEISTFQDFKFAENNFDLINAQYALPFHGPENFKEFIEKIKNSLKSGGVFVGQFFGINDSWNTSESKLEFQTKEEVLELLSGLKIVEFQEEKKDGKTAAGLDKHWHVFHFIAVK
jgi:tellurite methyltransferase